jgi:hypothetical protein
MGMEQVVTFDGDPPSWPAVRGQLVGRDFAVQVRMAGSCFFRLHRFQ